jgi:tetratricopeptide (TPR) repeat protein
MLSAVAETRADRRSAGQLGPREAVPLRETLVDLDVAPSIAGHRRALDGSPDLEPAEKLPHGTVVGRYILLEAIGEGGMGVVYAAYDPELDRRVAVKLLRSTEADDGSLGRARLLREAQSMARLSHPNVVGVHDVGTFEGRVFVAMELVVGRDLRAWLAVQQRTRQEIFDVFLQAGRGLAHAHAAGLVHRDFKPGNVLVGDDGVVRVADFGLARRFGVDPPEPVVRARTAEVDTPTPADGVVRVDSVTRTGAVLGTPAYMSAEQHLGRELDARSDQFSFCVALWEALQGERPFRATHPVELMVQVTRGEIAPSSKDAAMPAWIRRVLARGLAPDAAMRWPTMRELLAALERDPTRRRNRWLFASGGAVAVATAVLLVGRREGPCTGGEEELAAVWDSGRASTVTERFNATSLPFAQGVATDVVRRLDEYGAHWLQLRNEVCRAAEPLPGRPQDAPGMRCIERRRRDLGVLVDVLLQADAQLVERAHDVLGSLRSVESCADPGGRFGELLPPEDPGQRETTDALRDRISTVKVLDVANRWNEAIAISEPTLAEAIAVGDAPLIGEAELVHGLVLVGLGRSGDGVERIKDAAVWAVQGGHEALLLDAWIALVWHVGVERDDYDDASEWARFADALLERMGRPTREHGNLRAAQSAAAAAAGRYEDALVYGNEALEVRRREQPGEPIIAHTLLQIGNVLVALGRYDEARHMLEEARDLGVAVLGPDHPMVGAVENSLGVARHMSGAPALAEVHWRRAYAITEGALGPDHPDLFYSLGNIAEALLEQGKYDEALEAMRRVQALQDKSLPPGHREVGTTRHNIAQLELLRGDAEAALAGYRSALTVREAAFGPDDPSVANTLTGIGDALIALDRAAEAVPLLERALVIRDAKPRRAVDGAHTRIMLGIARARSGGDEAAARAMIEQGVAALSDVEGGVRDRLHAIATQWLNAH